MTFKKLNEIIEKEMINENLKQIKEIYEIYTIFKNEEYIKYIIKLYFKDYVEFINIQNDLNDYNLFFIKNFKLLIEKFHLENDLWMVFNKKVSDKYKSLLNSWLINFQIEIKKKLDFLLLNESWEMISLDKKFSISIIKLFDFINENYFDIFYLFFNDISFFIRFFFLNIKKK
jgi:hypothetical protein